VLLVMGFLGVLYSCGPERIVDLRMMCTVFLCLSLEPPHINKKFKHCARRVIRQECFNINSLPPPAIITVSHTERMIFSTASASGKLLACYFQGQYTLP